MIKREMSVTVSFVGHEMDLLTPLDHRPSLQSDQLAVDPLGSKSRF